MGYHSRVEVNGSGKHSSLLHLPEHVAHEAPEHVEDVADGPLRPLAVVRLDFGIDFVNVGLTSKRQ